MRLVALAVCLTVAHATHVAAAEPPPTPPKAEARPFTVKSVNGDRVDPYYWLRDDTRKNPDVLAYLGAEKAYADAALAPAKALEETLFGEMKARIKEADASYPSFHDGYWYGTRYEQGKQHPIWVRRQGKLSAAEEVILDANALAAGQAFYNVGRVAASRDGKLLAWTDDTVGRNQFVLHVKDLTTGKVLADTAAGIDREIAWANDSRTLFYVGKDAETLREDRIYRHVVGGAGADALVFSEKDASYYVSIQTTKSRRFLLITLLATTNTEALILDADQPAAPPRVFLPRAKDHIYSVDHLDGRFVVLSNREAPNFRVFEVPEARTADLAAWKEVIPHRAEALLEGVAVFHGYLAASVRSGGLRKVEIFPAGKPPRLLAAPEASYAMTVIDTPDPDAVAVRYSYDSLTSPNALYEVDLAGGKPRLLRQLPVPTYDASRYASEYLFATAADGKSIPISLVYKKTTKRDGKAPILIYAYGAYGDPCNPEFTSEVIGLLDRGWVYALVGVRGGSEMGRAWYEDGKVLKKKNTFSDYVSATEFLIARKYAAPKHVFAWGASAGGLLMGVVANSRPDLYRGMLVGVPFVDAVTTMLDDTIPLVSNEFDEWGNPQDRAAYDYMLSYSPYDNVKPQGYPALYVSTGLWDSQVQYYEPAKWVAKLRANKTDSNLLIFDIDMSSGHGGQAGRFEKLKAQAREMAFLLYVNGQPDARR